MLADSRKIIVWFLVALALAIYVKVAKIAPTTNVLGAKTASPSAGFGPLLEKMK